MSKKIKKVYSKHKLINGKLGRHNESNMFINGFKYHLSIAAINKKRIIDCMRICVCI